MSDITVVAGGWTVRAIDLEHLCGTVIAVNDAALKLPRVDIIVSMDRLWAEARWVQLWLLAGNTWLRRSAVQNLTERWGGLKIFECDHESTNFVPPTIGTSYQLNGTNSGLCALNLACGMRPPRLFLLGFDFNRSPKGASHWYADYPWRPGGTDGKYKQWAREVSDTRKQFDAAGIEVFNVSATSAVTGFKRMTPRQYRAECK